MSFQCFFVVPMLSTRRGIDPRWSHEQGSFTGLDCNASSSFAALPLGNTPLCTPWRPSGFCRALKLTPAQQVAVGLGLSRSPSPTVAKEGVKFLVARVPGLVGAGNGGHLSLEALHSLLELVNLREETAGQINVSLCRCV